MNNWILKKITILAFIGLISTNAFGAPGEVLFYEDWEYADQAALQAAGWSNTFAGYTFGNLPNVITDVKTHGEKSLFAEWGLAGKTIFGAPMTNIEVSVQWYYDPAGGYNSINSGLWLEQSDGAAEEAQVAFSLGNAGVENELGVQEWSPSSSTGWVDSGLVFVRGWNELRVIIDGNADATVYVNSEIAHDTYGDSSFWNGVRFIFLGEWWGPTEDEKVVFDELKILEGPVTPAQVTLTMNVEVSDPYAIGGGLIDPGEIDTVSPPQGATTHNQDWRIRLSAGNYAAGDGSVYVFDHWSTPVSYPDPADSNIVFPAAETTIRMNGNKTVTAHYTLSNERPFLPTGTTLSPSERQELYVDLIESFFGWAESSYWVNTSTLEPGGGYYNASGSGVTWARGNSNLCQTLAVLLTAKPSENLFSEYDIPRSQLEDHLEKTIRSLCLSNKNYSGHTATLWGGPSWQASLEFTGAAWAAYLQEGTLSPSTLDMVTEVLGDEAEALKKTIPYYTPGDTKAEDGEWNAQLLAFAANKLSADPRASSWDEWARKWAINSVSMPGDSTDDTTIVDGHSLSYWISGWNIFADYTLENHGFWHPAYNLEYGRMAQAEMAYKTFGNPIPEAFSFRHPQMWDNVGKILLLADGDAAYPQGNDWAYKDIQHQYYATWHCTARGRSEASAYESRGVQFQRQRQIKRGNGSICDFNFGYHTDLAYTLSICWLMHNHWTSASMAYDVAEADSYRVHQYPDARVAAHRNREKIVTVSWHPYGQGIHIMPQEGIDTFPDPPFYFNWQRDSGVIGTVSSSSLLNFESTHNDQGMRVTVKRPMNSNIDQYITVISLPDEATVYSTIFYAKNSTSYSVGQLFPLQARWLPESPGSVTQRRGTNWLNMSDYVGFVSPDTLPSNISSNEFYLTNTTDYSPNAGQWFSAAAVVVYTRQPNQITKWFADNISVIRNLPSEVFKLTMQSSAGTREIDLWPTHSASPTTPYCGDVDHPISPGDVTGIAEVPDCAIDMLDFAKAAKKWLLPAVPTDGDVSGPDGVPDGKIDLNDYFVLTKNWLKCTKPNCN